MFVVELFQTPGPGAYSPEKAPPLNAHRRPPSYTIGARTRYRSVDAVPAPNRWQQEHRQITNNDYSDRKIETNNEFFLLPSVVCVA